MYNQPILYSFRRCPYAIRARIALFLAGIAYTIREVDLKNKPRHLLSVSPKGTVPVLITSHGIIDESMDIVHWALEQSCPDTCIQLSSESRLNATSWCAEIVPNFIWHLNRIKYPNRYVDVDMEKHIEAVHTYILSLNIMLDAQPFLYGDKPCFADISLYPFIRQLHIVNSDLLLLRASEPLIKWFNWWKEHPMQSFLMK